MVTNSSKEGLRNTLSRLQSNSVSSTPGGSESVKRSTCVSGEFGAAIGAAACFAAEIVLKAGENEPEISLPVDDRLALAQAAAIETILKASAKTPEQVIALRHRAGLVDAGARPLLSERTASLVESFLERTPMRSQPRGL